MAPLVGYGPSSHRFSPLDDGSSGRSATNGTCEWHEEDSPAAATEAVGGRWWPAAHHWSVRPSGRWVSAGAGLTTDTAGAVAAVRLVSASSVHLVLHEACGVPQGLVEAQHGPVHCSTSAASPARGWAVQEGLAGPVINDNGVVVDLLVNRLFAGSLVLRASCEGAPHLPDSHSMHTLQLDCGSRACDLHLVVRSDAKRGGVTLRGAVLPRRASLVPLRDEPARGRLVAVGGSNMVGMCSLSEDGEGNPEQLPQTQQLSYHPHYAYASHVAHELGLEYSFTGFARFHYGSIGRCSLPSFFEPNISEPVHRWYTSALLNDALDATAVDFEQEEARLLTRLVVIDLQSEQDSKQTCSMARVDAGFEDWMVSLLRLLHQLHPRAMLLLKPKPPVAARACREHPSICRWLLPALPARPYLGHGCNYHLNSIQHQAHAAQILSVVSSALEREPVPQSAETGGDVLRSHSAALLGDLTAKWRYMPAIPGTASVSYSYGGAYSYDEPGSYSYE